MEKKLPQESEGGGALTHVDASVIDGLGNAEYFSGFSANLGEIGT